MVDYHHSGSGTQNNNNANNQNVNYGGDQNIVSYSGSGPNPPRTLEDAVAGIGASHTAEQQHERGECLEETRVELRRIIHDWGKARRQEKPVFWLAGAAGVGKTAIAMSVAKACEREGHLVSSFFFFRSDPKRNNPKALWLTIAHGLASTIPFMRRLIERRVSKNSMILEAKPESQFRELISDPIVEWNLWAFCSMLLSVVLLDIMRGFLIVLLWFAPLQVPCIVIIDGLDECGHESAQLRILDIICEAVQHVPHFPLRFLICSRPEAWIQERFDAEPLCKLTKVIWADNALEDIIRYCHHHFQDIVSSPKYGHVRFPDPWPSQEDFGTLVDKSCSQFVYVSTAVKFITLGDNHPIDQLRLVLESSPSDQSGVSPFRELNALYYTILKANHSPKKVHDILVAILILPDYLEPTPAHIEWLLGLSSGQVTLTLRGMHSVLRIRGPADMIHIHHTSFKEYLVDQGRSQRFYVDESAQRYAIAQQWVQRLTTSKIQGCSFDQLYGKETRSLFTEWVPLCTSLSRPTRDFLRDLQNVDLPSTFLCKHVKNRSLLRRESDFAGNFDPKGSDAYATIADACVRDLSDDAIAGVGASHKAEQQFERGSCLPGTREELLRLIHEWIQGGGSPLCWLTGGPGVGKTAIAMTIAKVCEQTGVLVSSFFFFRLDPKRNKPAAFVPSLAHGILSTIPSTRRLIEGRISEDRRILVASLEDQFRELVLNPILQCGLTDPPTTPPIPKIVIIDGLDECSDERTQLRIINIIQEAVQHAPDFPLRFLICSRPEAWLKEGFAASPLCNLSKVILIDDEFGTAKDIETYCRRHFQMITSDPKYNQVQFPSPWPSQEDIGILVQRSCNRIVYMATLFKYLTLGDNHPVDELRLVLIDSPDNQTGASPFLELDTLYHTILAASPDRDKVQAILVVILTLTNVHEHSLFTRDALPPTPAHIELLLGLPSGQVALTLRGMHSVLHIRGWADEIYIHHTSFREFLLDQNRSRDFHIDILAQECIVARRWLKGLTASKMQDYSPDQLCGEDTKSFFTQWRPFCASLRKPTRDLLEPYSDLCSSTQDLPAYTFRVSSLGPTAMYSFGHTTTWHGTFGECRSWLQRCTVEDGTEPLFKSTARDEHQNNGDRDINGGCGSVDLMKDVLAKFAECPTVIHLECSPGVGLEDPLVRQVVVLTTQCRWSHSPLVQKVLALRDRPPLRLSDCSCNVTGGKQSSDPKHLAYQEACVHLFEAFIWEFGLFSHGPATNAKLPMNAIFRNVVQSSLLQHCRLDAELLSLCRTFFDYARRRAALKKIYMGADDVALVQAKLLEWIETFPLDLAEEGDSLKAQVLALPWSRWTLNDSEGDEGREDEDSVDS
ncbi:hypothetical protein PM082_011602 [Marasmius tenuissimus]|nr:hypothetical protein PM082_011602 [Marasmius tenuissimus]